MAWKAFPKVPKGNFQSEEDAELAAEADAADEAEGIKPSSSLLAAISAGLGSTINKKDSKGKK